MKLRTLFVSAFLCVLMMVTHASSAQPLQPLDYEPEWLQQMYAQGWWKVEEGVLQRGAEEGQLETFTYGAEGLQWVVRDYERRILFFEEQYSRSPDEKLAELIQSLRDQVEALNSQMLTAPAAEELQGEVLDACSFSFDAPVSARPLQSAQGVMATAQAYWQNDCNHQGTVYAYAYTHAKDGTVDNTSFDAPPMVTGPSVQVSAIASVVGSTECYSEASAQVSVPALSINYQPPTAQNYSCWAPPVVASISGPASISLATSTECKSISWTASATGGSSGYTYSWYIGTSTTVQGTGATLTKSYCGPQTVNVKVVARDSAGQTDDATFATTLAVVSPLTASISGTPATFILQAGGCRTLTWTANASGGTPAYSYSWYVGTSTTIQGTASSLTKTFCGPQTINVKVTVRDAAARTVNAAYTTTITLQQPVNEECDYSGPAVVCQ